MEVRKHNPDKSEVSERGMILCETRRAGASSCEGLLCGKGESTPFTNYVVQKQYIEYIWIQEIKGTVMKII